MLTVLSFSPSGHQSIAELFIGCTGMFKKKTSHNISLPYTFRCLKPLAQYMWHLDFTWRQCRVLPFDLPACLNPSRDVLQVVRDRVSLPEPPICGVSHLMPNEGRHQLTLSIMVLWLQQVVMTRTKNLAHFMSICLIPTKFEMGLWAQNGNYYFNSNFFWMPSSDLEDLTN